ncbi:MAG: DUF3363 domain-containing protein [Hyphomicrobiaceae bacterium]|nr:DUF3363 domain-containing protein [Hyphomicrobiaceae bacterium]
MATRPRPLLLRVISFGLRVEAGRLKTLERLGLAEEHRPGVWALDAGLETKLRQLGERADTYRMMAHALQQADIERGGRSLPSSSAAGG